MDILRDAKFLVLLPALVGFLRVGVRRQGWTRWMGLLMVIVVGLEGWCYWLSSQQRSNTLYYDLYMPVEFVLLCAVIWEIAGRKTKVRTQLLIGLCIVLTVFTFETSHNGGFAQFNTNTLIIGGFCLTVLSGLGLFRLLEQPEPLIRLPEFWALLSITAYFIGIIPVFGLYNYLAERSSELASDLIHMNDVLYVVRYGMVSVAFFLASGRDLRLR
ncbi:MAG: hypothetical protein JNL05_08165 [Flavobacteriales bacterium]|nr:hypothetical protein [Flavobacteriales bacterium]